MSNFTVPGVVQIRVIADAGDTESLSKMLTFNLGTKGYKVIACTTDYPDRSDETRKRFHITAIKQQAEPMLVSRGGN